MTPPRQHPRRRLLGRRPPVIHHAPDPAQNVAADLEALEPAPDVSRETSAPDPGRAAQELVDAVLQATPEEVARLQAVAEELAPPPPLSRERIARLEAATAQWVREVRIGGPGPDDTILYGGPSLPPVPPPARRPEPVITVEETPAVPTDQDAQEAAARQPLHVPDGNTRLARRLIELSLDPDETAPPRRASDWSSRHDPRSLEYAVRARLSRPVPLQDFILERGPVLDQGTTPPLALREASACVGMAVVAAANALDASSHPSFNQGRTASTFLDVEDARRIYARAQDLDHVSGHDYAGTSVLAGMKAGQEAGYWDTYLWALGGTRDVAQAVLQLRAPVVVGVPWTTGLEEPSPAGVIEPTGKPAGGHALAVVGLRLSLRGVGGPWFVLQQSRGLEEGDQGLVYLHHTNLARMLAGVGEAGVPLPRWGQL